MRRALTLIGLAIVIGVVSVAVAGDKHACTASAQDCLDKMMAKIKTKGWLGVETESLDNGRWQVTSVYPDSPAQAAGFKPGDVLVAMNGIELSEDNKAALKKAKHKLGPGSQVAYVVKRQGGKVKLTATLGEVPSAVAAEWIGKHMVDQHASIKLAAK
jgi:S1-C subfamily serine protease